MKGHDMIQTLAPRDGGIPIAADACMMCVAETSRWGWYYARPRTLCSVHFREWADEKAD